MEEIEFSAARARNVVPEGKWVVNRRLRIVEREEALFIVSALNGLASFDCCLYRDSSRPTTSHEVVHTYAVYGAKVPVDEPWHH
jgi:hypothetical protein